MKGHLVMRSVNRVAEKGLTISQGDPKVLELGAPCYTVGGYSAVSEDGRSYSFDWDCHEGYARIEDGFFIVESLLSDFSEDYVETNLEDGVEDSELTPEFLTNSELSEVYYECYPDPKSETPDKFIQMEVVSFGVSESGKAIYYSPEAISRINTLTREMEGRNLLGQYK